MKHHTTAFLSIVALLLCNSHLYAQSAADQALKTLPQTTKDNGENKVVTKSNTVSNDAMNKLDSASNKALKGFTGLLKKKNKAKKSDSAAVHPADTTSHAPRTSYRIYRPASICANIDRYMRETPSFVLRNQRKNYLL